MSCCASVFYLGRLSFDMTIITGAGITCSCKGLTLADSAITGEKHFLSFCSQLTGYCSFLKCSHLPQGYVFFCALSVDVNCVHTVCVLSVYCIVCVYVYLCSNACARVNTTISL